MNTAGSFTVKQPHHLHFWLNWWHHDKIDHVKMFWRYADRADTSHLQVSMESSILGKLLFLGWIHFSQTLWLRGQLVSGMEGTRFFFFHVTVDKIAAFKVLEANGEGWFHLQPCPNVKILQAAGESITHAPSSDYSECCPRIPQKNHYHNIIASQKKSVPSFHSKVKCVFFLTKPSWQCVMSGSI